MNLCSNGTEELPQSHVDLDDVMAALKTGMVSAHEARIATALRLNPDLTGLRALEVASGLCDDTVLKVLPTIESPSVLLERIEQGSFAWEPQDRSPLVVGHRSFVGHKASLSSKTPEGQGALQGDQGSRDHERLSARQMTGFLDPSLDVWANTPEGLGDHGWVLAMVTKMRETTFTLDELKGILRLGERQLRRVLDKMGSWVRRVKEGRRALIVVDFSWMAHEDLAREYLKKNRAARKADDRMLELDALTHIATDVGRRIREMWRDRLDEARRIREYLAVIPERMHYRYESLLRILEGRGRRWVGIRALWRLFR